MTSDLFVGTGETVACLLRAISNFFFLGHIKMAKKASLIQKLDEWLPISYEICKAEQVNRVRVKKLVILNRLEICSVGSNSIFFHTEFFFFNI